MFRQDFALFRSFEVTAARKPKRAIRKKIGAWVEARKKGPVLVPEPPDPFKRHQLGESPPRP
jgi:hypothetical protein